MGKQRGEGTGYMSRLVRTGPDCCCLPVSGDKVPLREVPTLP